MKPLFKRSSHFQTLTRSFLAAAAALALSVVQTFAEDVNAIYTTGEELPVSSYGFTAMGKTVNLKLNFSPTPGTQLMVVRNTEPGIIKGYFSNLGQGRIVALTYAGVTYHFVADYHGGMGNDLVLLWTNGNSLPADKKLDDQLLLALKQSRGEAPFDKPTSLRPDVPAIIDGRAFVDIQASVSRGLLDQIARLGGQVIDGSVTAAAFQAMVPLSQLETLAGGAEINSISPARPSITSKVEP